MSRATLLGLVYGLLVVARGVGYAAEHVPHRPICQCNTPGFCETAVGAACINLSCFYPPATGRPCDDGNPNTNNDACDNLKHCIGIPIPTPTSEIPTPEPTPTASATATVTPAATVTATETATETATPTSTSLPTVAATPTATVTPKPCLGDCNGDNEVTIDELLQMVRIALGEASVDACPAGDADGDGTISIDAVILAVNNTLNGCPVGATS
ncbi:MAG TPA: dockerin type I repeat-containing protein [Candidatus Acidoferrales bacterium]|nr:dockerin type I repeat-containing protein [Candidatus Acidoferrales bacterium]